MKKFFLSLILSVAAFAGANAMSFSRAQAEALYLTDKMAYELNLNDQQYNDAYEINLDYFLRMESPSDAYGYYYDYRLSDLRCILHDWQYSLLVAADYFLRPIAWRAGGWFFPIYSYYDRGRFFYGRPRVWVTYRGGHSRFYHSAGFYMHRRPMWNGGLRGRDMGPHHGGMHGRSGGMHGHGGVMRGGSGRGYHFDLNGRQGGGSNRQHQGGSNYGQHSGGYGNHHGGSNYGQHSGGYGNRQGGSNYGQHGSSRSGIISGSPVGRGNSFDGSSSRLGGYSGSGVSRSYSGGSSRGSGMTRSYSGGGSSRGSSMTRSGGAGFGGGSRGGGMSDRGSSRSGRR